MNTNKDTKRTGYGLKAFLLLLLIATSITVYIFTTDDIDPMNEWHTTIVNSINPGQGCYEAEYPTLEWTEVECFKAPDRARLPSKPNVRNGDDWSITTSESYTSAMGYFQDITGLTSEKDVSNPPDSMNNYTLQLNTSYFSSSACNNTPSCKGWQQFIYQSNGAAGGSVYMQYWLLNYNTTCPTGWSPYDNVNCYRNSPSSLVPALDVTDVNLYSMSLIAQATSGENDQVILKVGKTLYQVAASDAVLSLAGKWQAAEFNILGNANGSSADFNSGTNIKIGLLVKGATSSSYISQSYTGETNNLTLDGNPKLYDFPPSTQRMSFYQKN